MVRVDTGAQCKHRNHVRRSYDHLNVVADHEYVRHALKTLLLNRRLNATSGMVAIEEAALGEEEGPERKTQRYRGLADESNYDLDQMFSSCHPCCRCWILAICVLLTYTDAGEVCSTLADEDAFCHCVLLKTGYDSPS